MNRSTFAVAALLAATLHGHAAWAAGPQKGMLPGFLNPKTGTFTLQPAMPSEQDMQTLASQVYDGVLSLKFTITIKSPIPTTWPIHCTQVASVVDPSGLYYSDSKTVIATRNGSTATCTVNINYAWTLTSPTDQVSVNYMVSSTGTSTSLVQLETIGTMPNITIPADGGSSIRNVAVTL